MKFSNRTLLDSARLEALFRRFAGKWPLDGLDVRVRYTRSSPFSGLCCYRTGRININIGRGVKYPYALATHVARARSEPGLWWRPIYLVNVQDGYQLALFIFMHELYHWLIKKARRNTRQKEGRCDRFALRALVEAFGLEVVDKHGRAAPREDWDFQDLDGFVARAQPRSRAVKTAARKPRPIEPSVIVPPAGKPPTPTPSGDQLWLFSGMG